MKGEKTGRFTLSWDGRVLEEREGPEGEIWITWRPCVMGGKDAPTITGLGEKYLPRGVALELLKVTRRGDECVARYRVHEPGR
jgi:riboflavin biosynthesis pyrimidine reductase